MSFARRVQEIEPFLAVEVAERAAVLERAGVDVVHLEYGEPDFEAPAVVRDALEKAVKDGRMRYTHSLGILPLREAIAEHYAATYGVTVSPEQILVTPGTSPAMLLLFGHLLDAGDEVSSATVLRLHPTHPLATASPVRGRRRGGRLSTGPRISRAG